MLSFHVAAQKFLPCSRTTVRPLGRLDATSIYAMRTICRCDEIANRPTGYGYSKPSSSGPYAGPSLSDGAGDEASEGEDAASSLEALEAAKAGNAIDTAKAKTAQSMRLIEVMGAEARKWKQRRNRQSRSIVGRDRRGPTMHACTMRRREHFIACAFWPPTA